VRLGILATHPIQYQAPWFRALAREADLEVFFAHRPDAAQQGEGFGKAFDWDVDLLSDYKHRFLVNVAKNPSASRFSGCDTPEIASIITGEREKAESRKQKAEISVNSPISYVPSPRLFDAFIVSGWQVKAYWQAVRACRKAGVPVFVRGDSQLNTPRTLLKRSTKFVTYRFALRQFHGFLSVGQRNREYLLQYAVPESRIFFVPHFVDNEWFRQKAEIERKQKAEIRRQLNIPENAFCILFCGKFIPKKRPMDLVKAAKLLMKRSSEFGVRSLAPGEGTNSNLQSANFSKVHLLFAGSGELGPQLRSACNVLFDAEAPRSPLHAPSALLHAPRSNLPSPISCLPPASFPGFLNQSEMPRAYVAADVLVLPSDGGETWGLVVNEAMACGLPAIVSDAVGCAPDLIDEGQTGFTFPMGDTNALADRLARCHVLRQKGHDFTSALKAKLERYSVQTAVKETIAAVSRTGGSVERGAWS
jgi:glycosyltransferase involved in cell wall biosynthesis